MVTSSSGWLLSKSNMKLACASATDDFARKQQISPPHYLDDTTAAKGVLESA
jgi:hypothetical protein